MLWAKLLGKSSVPVLCYHNIDGNGMPWKKFTAQMEWLKSAGVQTLTLGELKAFLEGKPLEAPSVCITFDDGFRDIYTRVSPYFESLGFHGVSFVINNRIRPEDEPGQDTEIIAHEAHRGFLQSGDRSAWMSLSEIRSIVENGTFEIGSHSMTHMMIPGDPQVEARHPDHWAHEGRGSEKTLSEIYPEFSIQAYLLDKHEFESKSSFKKRVRENISQSITGLSKKTGVSVKSLGWPWGAVAPEALEAVKQTSVEVAFSLKNGPVTPASNKYLINRLEVRRKKELLWFQSRIFLYSHAILGACYAGMRI